MYSANSATEEDYIAYLVGLNTRPYPKDSNQPNSAAAVKAINEQLIKAYSPFTTKVNAPITRSDADPNGKSAHSPGAKLDANKDRPALVLGGFARALLAVSRIGTFGASKYTENGWQEVPKGIDRYDDAQLRHWLLEHAGESRDPESAELHAAHAAWNALARLDLLIRQKEVKK